MKSLPYILPLLLLCSCSWFGTGVKPQRPSNSHEPDTAREAMLKGNQAFAEQAAGQLREWAQAINDTLTGQRLFELHENGCWIRVMSTGEGEPATEGQMVEIAYTLELPDESIAEEREMSVKAGRKQTLDAIDYALTLLPPDSEAEILAPWQLLYGRQGSENVPPYSQARIRLKIKDSSQAR